MFPFEDENDELHWDEYGAALQPDEFQLKSTSRPGLLFALKRLPACFPALLLYLAELSLSQSSSVSTSV